MGDFRHVQGQPILMQLVWLFFFMQFAIMMLQPILALYVGEMQGTMDNAAIVAGTILSIGGLAGAVTTNLWVCLGQNKGILKRFPFVWQAQVQSYCFKPYHLVFGGSERCKFSLVALL